MVVAAAAAAESTRYPTEAHAHAEQQTSSINAKDLGDHAMQVLLPPSTAVPVHML